MNRYLKDRAMRKDYRGDMRNPYGSRGGYVSSRHGRMRGRDRGMDYEYDYPEHDGRYDSRYDYGHESSRDYMGDQHYGERNRPMEYEMYGVGGMRPMYDYRGSRGRRMDYGYDYASEDMEKEYKEDLEDWISKLKKKDRFGLNKDTAIQKAKEMGVRFDEINELEYYAIYLSMVTDYPQISNDPHMYLAMAKDFIFDDDIQVSPSDKVCIYLYKIVLGE